MIEHWSLDRLRAEMTEHEVDESIPLAERWLERGDGVAVYENQDLGHPLMGDRQWMSYGSPAAQLETEEPPVRLPDIGGRINWRYQLIAVVDAHEWRLEEAEKLSDDDLARAASVCLRNNHKCGREAFTCAAVEVLILRVVEEGEAMYDESTVHSG